MSAERRLASYLLLTHETNRIFVGELDAHEQELFDKVLEQSDERTRGDWYCEGAINLYCNRGSVQIYGSNVI